MKLRYSDTERQVKEFCAQIGTDHLLVQGAGGNVSWKDGDTLWIKASGTWLAHADIEDIFVPVDLSRLKLAIAEGNFSVEPRVLGEVGLKPSIETLLHAAMPHKIVVHLHAIEALAYLVRKNCFGQLSVVLRNLLNWEFVEYFKPGAELAGAVNNCLQKSKSLNVIFMKNHGLIIGGDSVSQVNLTLEQFAAVLAAPKPTPLKFATVRPNIPVDDYLPIVDPELHQLSVDPMLFSSLKTHWALYPDHVVFLGVESFSFSSWDQFSLTIANSDIRPDLVFIEHVGVFTTNNFGKAKLAQLRCYYDVLVRQNKDDALDTLNESQILNLLNWDAELYRQSLASK